MTSSIGQSIEALCTEQGLDRVIEVDAAGLKLGADPVIEAAR